MIIRCKDLGFVGIRNGLGFSLGQAETDDQSKIDWFVRHGYEVIDPKAVKQSGSDEKEVKTEVELDDGFSEVEEFIPEESEVSKKRGRRRKDEVE